MENAANAVTALTQDLVRIESVNPDLVPGGTGEGKIALFVQTWLQERGFETHWLEATPGRPSVVGVARGTGGGRSLMLNGHLDTVTLAGYDGDALNPTIANGRVHGRGAYDMKSGVAALLIAAAHAKTKPLRGDVVVALVSDEENASLGTQEVLQHFRCDAGIVCEPTELELVTTHKGFVWANITTHGVAAHGSRPHLGLDAIAKMGRVLTMLEDLDARLRDGPAHPLLGTGRVHASVVTGGEELSSYPARCVLQLERRTVPGETSETLRQELQNILDTCANTDPTFKASLEMGLSRDPLIEQPDSALLRVLHQNAAATLGHAPKHSGVSYWTDAALMQAAGIETVLFGASGEGAHAATEWVDVSSLEQLCQVLMTTVCEFCA